MLGFGSGQTGSVRTRSVSVQGKTGSKENWFIYPLGASGPLRGCGLLVSSLFVMK